MKGGKAMKNIISVDLEKYRDSGKYQSEGNGIYKDLENKRYVITLRFELEKGDDSRQADDFQYPLEDILDKYYVNCTEHIVEEEIDGVEFLEVEIEDGNDEDFESLDVIKKIADLVGKRVYNKIVDGYLELTIE